MTNKQEKREFGVLMHISSLPSKYGIGSFGLDAYKFVDFLKEIKARYWQILPLGVTSYGDSPYQSFSSVGLNYYFIDLEMLVEDKLLEKREIHEKDFTTDENKVNYSLLFNNRIKLLKKAFSRFNTKSKSFKEFVSKKEYHDFAFFMTLKEINDFKPWYEFGKKYKTYSKKLENEVIKENSNLYLFYLFTQYMFLKQYMKLKKYANNKGIKIIGDMPIYVAYDSIEMYKNSDLFLIDSDRVPTLVSGCPPDEFSDDGQLWGNPIYNYEKMKENNYRWFNKRIKYNLSLFDLLRIDHFRGFSSYYAIPFGMKTARIGKWISGPEMDIFRPFLNKPIIAEDLGFKDDKLVRFLEETKFPGMKIIEFGFLGEGNEFSPENISYNFISFTGTHDNMTLLGYIKSLKKDTKKEYINGVKKSLEIFKLDNKLKTDEEIANAIIELSFACNSKINILPIQDMLLKDNSARMNTPSTLNGINWTYRITKKDITKDIINKYKKLVEKYKRY